MTNDEIFVGVQEIFREVFDDPTLEVTLQTSPEQIDDWDSFEQINLLMQIDKKFQVKFSMLEAVELYDVEKILGAIERKMKNK